MKPGDVVWILDKDEGPIRAEVEKIFESDCVTLLPNFGGFVGGSRTMSLDQVYLTEEKGWEAYCEQLAMEIRKMNKKLGLAQQHLHAIRMASADYI